MRLSLTRTGGFAGLMRPPIVVDTTSLAVAAATRCEKLLTAADFFHLPQELLSTQQPDRFQFSLLVERDDGHSHSVTFDETTDNASLAALAKLIPTLAK